MQQGEWTMDKVEIGSVTTPHVHVDRDARHLDAALRRLDLTAEWAELQRAEAWRERGHSAKTLLKYPDLRVVLIALNTGARLGEHQTKGRLALQVCKGRVLLTVGEHSEELAEGSLFALAPAIVHDVEALEPSAILLTVAWPTTV
jgi:quercetin dioxygenase-like cupin family protein